MLDTIIDTNRFEPIGLWGDVYVPDEFRLITLPVATSESHRQKSEGVLIAFQETKKIFIPYWKGPESEEHRPVLNLKEARFVITGASTSVADMQDDPANKMTDEIRDKLCQVMNLVPFKPEKYKGLYVNVPTMSA